MMVEERSRTCKAKGVHLEYSRVMCYNADLSRRDAEDLLHGLPAGAYLVRPCSDGGNKLSLSVMSEDPDVINHYLIRLDNGYRLDGRHDRFCCLQSFLRAHSQYHLGLQLKLRIPIFARSMFHKVEIWEYETVRGRWEAFSLDQTYRLATLRKTICPVYQFEDGTTVNLLNKTREVPCIHGPQIQAIRMRTVYGLCEKCTLRTVHPNVKHSQSSKSKTNKSKYVIWEYSDGNDWRCFEYGKASFQHLLASFSLLCENRSINDKAVRIKDRCGTQWYVDLANYKIVNCDLMKTYRIRKTEVHGISCNDTHQERERYLSQKDSIISRALDKMYCTSTYAVPSIWTSKTFHLLTPSSEDYKLILAQVPEARRNHVSSVVRIQDAESWRIFSKEQQLLSLSSKSVKLGLFWTDSTLLQEHESYDKHRLEESIVQYECYYFSKDITPTQNSGALILCKVLYDPMSSTCVVDNTFEATTVHLDRQDKDSVTPLFAIFFSRSLLNNVASSNKEMASKTVPLNIVP